MKPGTKITIEHGDGTLDIRALFAATVGPHRFAFAQRQSVVLEQAQGIKLAENIGSADSYALVGVALPRNAPVNPLSVMFSSDETMGFNTAIPARLVDSMSSGQTVFGFYQILMPGDQLFGQISDPAVQKQNVVVAMVMF